MFILILIIGTVCYTVGAIMYYLTTKDPIVFTALISTGATIFIASISLRFVYKNFKQLTIDKVTNMHYRFREERETLLKKIRKLDVTTESGKKDQERLYLDLLNELELISLLFQEGYFGRKIAKPMFNTWVKHIYDNKDIKMAIDKEKKNDPTAYEHLEKTYREWNKVKKIK